MTQFSRTKRVRALYNLDGLPDGTVIPQLKAALNGLRDHAAIYPNPPIDPARYEAAIAAYEDSIPAALDRSRTAVAQRNRLRETASRMYTELAHYVESHCNDDLATFLLSGFQPASLTKTPPQPIDQPTIAYLLQGPATGQLKFRIRSVENAAHYEVRYAPPADGAAAPLWTMQDITSTKATLVTDLKPGTTYTFQVRGFGRTGYTDWSDPVSRMVI